MIMNHWVDSKQCCWCSTHDPPESFEVESTAADPENIIRLLELLGLSPSLIVESIIDDRLCYGCADLVSLGTKLKVEHELLRTQFVKKFVLRQLEEVKSYLKDRCRCVIPLPSASKSPQTNPIKLGMLLSRCFTDCVVQLQPEDKKCIDDYRKKLSADCQSAIPGTSKVCFEEPTLNEFDHHQVKNELTHEDLDYGMEIDEASLGFEVTKMQEHQDGEHEAPGGQEKTVASLEGMFECIGCFETFSTLKHKNDHEKTHVKQVEGKTLYECGICKVQVANRINLKQHGRSHMRRPFVCYYCGKICASDESLQEHSKTHSFLRFECELCNKKFRRNDQLIRHSRVHTGALSHECEICDYKCAQKRTLLRHLQRHQPINKIAKSGEEHLPISIDSNPELLSTFVDQTFETFDSGTVSTEGKPEDRVTVIEHAEEEMEIQNRKEGDKIQNPHQELVVSNETNTQSVIDYEQQSDDLYDISRVKQEDIRVEEADWGTSSEEDEFESSAMNENRMLELGREQEATNVGEYECVGCPKTFKNIDEKHEHETVHRLDVAGKGLFACGLCSMKITGYKNLQRHRQKHLERPFTCSYCAKICASGDSLEQHMDTEHVLRFKCEVCCKRFRTNSELMLHRRMHTGEMPYKCEFCGVSFVRKYGLDNHRRTHTGEKPYVCEICQKRFKTAYNLKGHSRTHEREGALANTTRAKEANRPNILPVSTTSNYEYVSLEDILK